MFYLGIDLHRKQMTVCARDENGDVRLRRQVSTRPEKVEEFLAELRNLEFPYVATLEVCGFHDWLVKRLQSRVRCQEIVLIQPEKKSRRKTDRRDAHQLSEMLWVSRGRLLAGQKVQGVRRIYFPTDEEREDRQRTAVRQWLGRRRTKTLNQMHYIPRRNNLEWSQPTKGFQTRAVRKWLQTLALGDTDRLEMDLLLEQWELWDEQIIQLDKRIAERYLKHDQAKLLGRIIGVSGYMALAIASRIGDIRRFPTPRSLANFFGPTPTSKSSGETERLGSISKAGSAIVRFMLGQLVMHVLRKDARIRTWYKGIKRRRGSKIARVAVMRRLTVIMWHMLTKRVEYEYRWNDPAESASSRRNVKPVPVDLEWVDPVTEASTGSSPLFTGMPG
jgi:transposase